MAIYFAHVKNTADIRMRDSSRKPDLVEKPFQQSFVVTGFLEEKFERDRLSQRKVIGTMHFAHPTFAQQRDYATTSCQQPAWEGIGLRSTKLLKIRRLSPTPKLFADALGFESTNSMVASSSPETIAAPHDEQNRPASDTCEPHDTHLDIAVSPPNNLPSGPRCAPIATGNANSKITLHPLDITEPAKKRIKYAGQVGADTPCPRSWKLGRVGFFP